MKFVLRNLSSLPGHSPDPHTGGVTLEGIQTAGVGAIIHVLNSTMLNEKKEDQNQFLSPRHTIPSAHTLNLETFLSYSTTPLSLGILYQ